MRAEKCEKILVGEERESLKKRILQGLDFVYPYESETVLPVKNSVTKITEEAGGTVGGENLFKAEKLSLSVSSAENGKVVFTLSDDAGAERNEVGTAYHKFLENRDFNEKSADNELIRQLSQGDLSERQAKLLDKNVLQKVMDCKLFGEIEGYEIYREQPFMANYSAEEVGYKSSGEILVQGVIDLLAISGDFMPAADKTSFISCHISLWRLIYSSLFPSLSLALHAYFSIENSFIRYLKFLSFQA